jgi:transaldolase
LGGGRAGAGTGSDASRRTKEVGAMKLFLDTGNIEEIREINRWGVLSGVTTNPTLIHREGLDPEQVWKEILAEVEGDVSLETTEPEAAAMYEEGKRLAAFADNAVVKVPMTPAGLETGKRLVDEGVRINVTLVFSPAQAILAAEIGAYIVSPFIGRIDDAAADGMHALRQICQIYDVQGYTQVLAASLRHPMHVVESALCGADIATIPYEVFSKMVRHPLTESGLEKFTSDWADLRRRVGDAR